MALLATPKSAFTPEGENYYIETAAGLNLKMIRIAGGVYRMGGRFSPQECVKQFGAKPDGYESELPSHNVLLDDFWLSECEITNAQYRLFDPDHRNGEAEGRTLDGADLPVVNVSWAEAAAFCDWLSEQTGHPYSLPSEAQWEYACRAGASSPFFWGNEPNSLFDYANAANPLFIRLGGNFSSLDAFPALAPVGRFPANAFGFRDMIGNAAEWCQDWADAQYYSKGEYRNPLNATIQPEGTKIVRGGSWRSEGLWEYRSADRADAPRDARTTAIGFRICRMPDGTAPYADVIVNGVGEDYEAEANTIHLRMKWIHGGETIPAGSPMARPNEQGLGGAVPVVRMTGFWLSETEVTNAQYFDFVADKAYEGVRDSDANFLRHAPDLQLTAENAQRPVVWVSWHNAMAFCDWLSLKTGHYYVLPTEAQWEYACRAGSQSAWGHGDDPNQLGAYAWYADNASGSERAVGLKAPNAFGLFDMHGNVLEWCLDWHADDYYSRIERRDPFNSAISTVRSMRGGSFQSPAEDCRSARRQGMTPHLTRPDAGFRVCRVLERPAYSNSITHDVPGRAFDEVALGLNIHMVWAPGGSFSMGSDPKRGDLPSDEKPAHSVELDGFWISEQEITQAQYELAMKTNPARFRGARNPVESISWRESMDFCRRLSEVSGRAYTLPTEAQWEYACRAGTQTAYSFGDSLAAGDANFAAESTKPAGSYPRNPWGLFDMHGNVLEWCLDWHDANYYAFSPKKNPCNLQFSAYRVARGGAWDSQADSLRSAYRYKAVPDSRQANIGFRICLNPSGAWASEDM
ncbi:MAG: Serine/threonine-protein kinase pkn1 [candidate division BRC1 bacterium ADurb.BinA364]|nr:MAG: Serine/threonine-protein kinase pkn1 [candidate division BRC1 bacterium ADurb.BinA364]